MGADGGEGTTRGGRGGAGTSTPPDSFSTKTGCPIKATQPVPTIQAGTSYSAPLHSVILEDIELDEEDGDDYAAPGRTTATTTTTTSSTKQRHKASHDSSTLGPSASVAAPVPCCTGCLGSGHRSRRASHDPASATSRSATRAPSPGAESVDPDEAKDEFDSVGVPALNNANSSSLVRSFRSSTMGLSQRFGKMMSSLFFDAEEPDEHEDKQFFRSLSRSISKRSIRRKENKIQRSLRDLGIETLDDSDILPNFIEAAKGDMVEARRAFVEMLKWRKANKIDTILLEKQEDFEQIVEASPHFLCGRTRDGGMVSYELNGRTDISLFSKYKIKPNAIGRHSACIMEYSTYELYDGQKDGFYYAVFDLKGMNLMKASSPMLLDVLRTYAETLTYNYPNILRKVLVVNPPFGAATIIKILRAVLPRDFNKSIVIINDHKELLEYIDADELLVAYGGKNTTTPATSEPWQGLIRMIDANRRGEANYIYAKHSKAAAERGDSALSHDGLSSREASDVVAVAPEEGEQKQQERQ